MYADGVSAAVQVVSLRLKTAWQKRKPCSCDVCSSSGPASYSVAASRGMFSSAMPAATSGPVPAAPTVLVGNILADFSSTANAAMSMSQEYDNMWRNPNSSQSATKEAPQTSKWEREHQQEVEQQEGPSASTIKAGSNPTAAAIGDAAAREQIWAQLGGILQRCMRGDATNNEARAGLDLLMDLEDRDPCSAGEVRRKVAAAAQFSQGCNVQPKHAAAAASTQKAVGLAAAAAAADAMAANLIAKEEEATAKKQAMQEAAAAAAKQKRQGEHKQQQQAGKQQLKGGQLQHTSKLDSKATAAASEKVAGARDGDKHCRGSGPRRLGACGRQGHQKQQHTDEDGPFPAGAAAAPEPVIPASSSSAGNEVDQQAAEALSSAEGFGTLSNRIAEAAGKVRLSDDHKPAAAAPASAMGGGSRAVSRRPQVGVGQGGMAGANVRGAGGAAARTAIGGARVLTAELPAAPAGGTGDHFADAPTSIGQVPTTEAAAARAAEITELFRAQIGAIYRSRMHSDATVDEASAAVNPIVEIRDLSPCSVDEVGGGVRAAVQSSQAARYEKYRQGALAARAAAADAMAAKLIAEEEEAAAKKQAKQEAAAAAAKAAKQKRQGAHKQHQQQAGKPKGGQPQHSSKLDFKGSAAASLPPLAAGRGVGVVPVNAAAAAAAEHLIAASSSSAVAKGAAGPEGQAGSFQPSRAAGGLSSAEDFGTLSNRIAGAAGKVCLGDVHEPAAAPMAQATGGGNCVVSRRSPAGVGQGVAGAADVRGAGGAAARTAIGGARVLTAELPATTAGGGGRGDGLADDVGATAEGGGDFSNHSGGCGGGSGPRTAAKTTASGGDSGRPFSQQQQQAIGRGRQLQKDDSVQQLQQVGMKKSPVKPSKRPSPCVVCWESPPCVVLLPCKHLVLCEACSKMMEGKGAECPMCRATVEQHMMIFSA